MITSQSSEICKSMGWSEMRFDILRASVKRVKIYSCRCFCTKKSQQWHGVIVAAAGDAVYLAINKSISCC